MRESTRRGKRLFDRGRRCIECSTFVVTPDGRIAATFDGLSPVENVEHALAAVQQLAHRN